MTASQGKAVARKQKMFFLNDNGVVLHEMGYECPPNDNVWWFPSVGYSTGGVYSTHEAAKKDAMKWIMSSIKELEAKKAKLESPPREGEGKPHGK